MSCFFKVEVSNELSEKLPISSPKIFPTGVRWESSGSLLEVRWKLRKNFVDQERNALLWQCAIILKMSEVNVLGDQLVCLIHSAGGLVDHLYFDVTCLSMLHH